MKVKAKTNFIYDGTFRKVGEIFPMKDADAADYAKRGWVAMPAVVKLTDTPPPEISPLKGLPPLEAVSPRKKK